MTQKIDIVVTWVDGTDPKWLEEKSNYAPATNHSTADTANRYAPSDLFKYWFRGVEKNAPWVNKIFFITYGHVPEWLNVNHPKLRIVKHEEYIPENYLPTYNSNVIELNLHRLEDLSENFILFNDDMFIIQPVKEEDFFVNNITKSLAIYKPILPIESFNHTQLNNTIVINKYFKAKEQIKKNPLKFFRIANGVHNLNNLVALLYPSILGYNTGHYSYSHYKSTFKEIWNKEPELLDNMCKNRFRSETDLSHYLMLHWNVESGKFVPQDTNFGKYFSNNQVSEISQELVKNKHKVICINDDTDSTKLERKLIGEFQKKYPEKSSFELD